MIYVTVITFAMYSDVSNKRGDGHFFKNLIKRGGALYFQVYKALIGVYIDKGHFCG